jgi:DNA-damage-inducible protein J
MAQTNINIRMDATLKTRAENLFNELGMNMTTAFNVFVRQAVRQQKIPFDISAEKLPSVKKAAKKRTLWTASLFLRARRTTHFGAERISAMFLKEYVRLRKAA